jgi:hypothetical protein
MSFISDGFILLIVFYLAYSYVVSPINGIWMGLTGQDIPPPETYSQQISKCWEYFYPWNYTFLSLLFAFFVASYKQQFADIVNAIFFAMQLIDRLVSIIFAFVPAAPEIADSTPPERERSAIPTHPISPRARGRSPGRVQSPAPAQSPGPAKTWKVNSRVTAPYKETGNRFHATVKEDFNDGTYRIAWKDGDLTDTIKKGEDLRRSNRT